MVINMVKNEQSCSAVICRKQERSFTAAFKSRLLGD